MATPWAAGCWRGGANVLCTVGRGQSVWPLYHELCHRVYNLWDHSDPRWVGWNVRMLALGARLEARP